MEKSIHPDGGVGVEYGYEGYWAKLPKKTMATSRREIPECGNKRRLLVKVERWPNLVVRYFRCYKIASKFPVRQKQKITIGETGKDILM